MCASKRSSQKSREDERGGHAHLNINQPHYPSLTLFLSSSSGFLSLSLSLVPPEIFPPLQLFLARFSLNACRHLINIRFLFDQSNNPGSLVDCEVFFFLPVSWKQRCFHCRCHSSSSSMRQVKTHLSPIFIDKCFDLIGHGHTLFVRIDIDRSSHPNRFHRSSCSFSSALDRYRFN